MKFDDIDKLMRLFETSNDRYVLPEVYIIARIDGRSFTKLTKKTCNFDAPFDERFKDIMVETVKHLMNCGFRIIYGYTQSDEISLLLDKNDNTFHRKARKLESVLAGEASAAFSVQLGKIGAFDCRLCELPNERLVADYFRWRQEDAHRNSLNAHCYWMLRKEGINKTEATRIISKKSITEKIEMLSERGINYDCLPCWQTRGIGLYHGRIEKEGYNPITKEKVITTRSSIIVDTELPTGQMYSEYILSKIL